MLNMHIISESVLMMSTANYQNWFMLVEAIACQIWRVFLRHSVVVLSLVRILSCAVSQN